jgi:hypothetical protein
MASELHAPLVSALLTALKGHFDARSYQMSVSDLEALARTLNTVVAPEVEKLVADVKATLNPATTPAAPIAPPEGGHSE